MRRKTTLSLAGWTALAMTAGLLLAAAPAQAQSTAARSIVVSGQGQAVGVPDQATITAGVLTQAATAKAALDANTKAMNAVFGALKTAGIADRDIQTSNFSVSSQYEPYRENNPQPAKVVGYQVSNSVSVVVKDLAKLGGTLDALVKSGANQLNGIQFSIATPKPLEEKARTAAVQDAMAKAKTLAAAAGVKLGAITAIEETSSSDQAPRPLLAMRVAADAKVPVAAGEQSITVSVNLTYAIQ
jgi:uncharacterized protein YggE